MGKGKASGAAGMRVMMGAAKALEPVDPGGGARRSCRRNGCPKHFRTGTEDTSWA